MLCKIIGRTLAPFRVHYPHTHTLSIAHGNDDAQCAVTLMSVCMPRSSPYLGKLGKAWCARRARTHVSFVRARMHLA